MVVGSNPVAVTSPSDFAPASSKEFLDIQATIECGFTLKRVRDMIITYSKPICNVNNFYFIVQDLYGTIEKIDGSKERYLVIDKSRDINKQNIDLFNDLWSVIIDKIKYLRKDDVMFDDNEVIIQDWNKIRFSSDVFMPNDVLNNFYSSVIVINYVIEKNDEFITEIYINEGLFEKINKL